MAAGGILLADMPEALSKRLPRYPSVPVARFGRLAVALAFQGIGLGGALLWDAVDRAARSEVAVYALVVDAKDEQAASFYRHHGFAPFGPAQVQLDSARVEQKRRLSPASVRAGRSFRAIDHEHFHWFFPGLQFEPEPIL